MTQTEMTRQMTIRLDGEKQKFFDDIKSKTGITSDTECFKVIIEQYRKIVKRTGLVIFSNDDIEEMDKAVLMKLQSDYKELKDSIIIVKNELKQLTSLVKE